MKRKSLLATGAGGMVGSYVGRAFSDFDLVVTDIRGEYLYLDVRDRLSVERLIGKIKPDFVLHLAAATDVDMCELEPEWAFEVNVEGTRNVALACRKQNSVMIYVSTGAVFNGKKKKPYVETDKPCPLNKYGMYKYEGEKIIESLLRDFYIVRASWMIGGGKNDKKFVGKIMHKIMSGENNIKAVNDKFGSITYAKDLAYGIGELIKTDKFGFYHMTNGGMHTRYDIVRKIMDILNKNDLEIIPVTCDEFFLPAPRGRSEALENYNLQSIGLNCMGPWKEVLREYITQELLPLYR